MYEVELMPSPFWGEDRNTKGGRDPLAIQNSSVMIYSDMVSGITNLTSRIDPNPESFLYNFRGSGHLVSLYLNH